MPRLPSLTLVAVGLIAKAASAQLPLVVEGPRTYGAEEVHALLREYGGLVLKHITVDGDLLVAWNDSLIYSLETYQSVFNGAVDIGGHRSRLHFEETEFKGKLDLYLAEVDDFYCWNCVFRDDANLHSLVSKTAHIGSTTFEGDAIFVATRFDNLNIPDPTFRATVDFSGALIGSLNAPRIRTAQPVQITWLQLRDAWLPSYLRWVEAPTDTADLRSRAAQLENELVFWKRNFEALGRHRDAKEVNFHMINFRRRLQLDPSELEYWVILIVGLPNRFGTRPYRPLWVALITITMFGLVYWKKDPFIWDSGKQVSRRFAPLYALLYSLDTFVPFVNLTGVKEWGATLSQESRYIELTERLLGLAISGLAAYSVGSYIF